MESCTTTIAYEKKASRTININSPVTVTVKSPCISIESTDDNDRCSPDHERKISLDRCSSPSAIVSGSNRCTTHITRTSSCSLQKSKHCLPLGKSRGSRADQSWLDCHWISESSVLFSVPAIWNEEVIYNMGQMRSLQTIYKGIQQLAPGHLLIATENGTVNISKYYDASYITRAEEQNEQRTEGEMVEGVRQRLLEAVRLRMRADVKIGVYLSGGLDSSTTLGMATTLTDLLDLLQRPCLLTQGFEQCVYHYEYPLATMSGVGKYLLSKTVRENHGKVVLTGEGSDEIFSGWATKTLFLHQISTNTFLLELLSISRGLSFARFAKRRIDQCRRPRETIAISINEHCWCLEGWTEWRQSPGLDSIDWLCPLATTFTVHGVERHVQCSTER